ncbi:hypothetical protein [Kocuria sp.]|uniref:hypothetical protein n=1 Tax=Kocuria sp. TaxID=1871328 RepID=UPI0026DFFB90|nr:hypothetical protein [Kocuria sp.]MDO5619545.1 hypothetical protein [Kocuria sp.]
MRYLLLATQPTRHHYIAAVLGTSQQSVSNSARSLGPLVEQTAQGLVAADKSALLAHWVSVYPGPGGQPFGWYSVETPREQASKALELAQLLGDNALLSGDMAADHLAPWKTPTHSIVYTHSPVGLSEDGFVPAPVDQATLVTCTPMDPTVWKLAALMNDSGAESLSLADPALIYWDTRNGTDPDSQEAADQIARLLLSHRDE